MATPGGVALESRQSFDGVSLAAGALGLVCGLLCLKAWWLAVAALLGVGLVGVGLRHPFMTWRVMMACVLLLFCYVTPYLAAPLVWLVLGVWAAGAWRARPAGAVFWGSRALWMTIGFWMAWAALSAVQAVNHHEAIKEVGRYALSFGVLLTYLNWLRDDEQIWSTWQTWQAVMIASAVIGLGELIAQAASAGLRWHVRGPYAPNPGEVGSQLAAYVPMALGMTLASAQGRRSLWRWVGLAAVFAAIVSTKMAAGLLAASVGAVCVALWLLPKQRPLLIGLLVLGGLGGVAWLHHRYGEILVGAVHELSGRDRIWQAAWAAFRESPVLGIGPGSWSEWFGEHYTGADFILPDLQGNTFILEPSMLSGEAHNLFFTKAAEMGWPSVVGMVVMGACWSFAACRAIRRMAQGRLRTLAIGAVAAMAGLLARSMLENGPLIGRARGSEIILVWYLAALPLVLGRMNPQGRVPVARGGGQAARVAGAAVAVTGVGGSRAHA